MAWEVEERVMAELRKEVEDKPISKQEFEIAISEAIKGHKGDPNGLITADQLALKVLSQMQNDDKPMEYKKFQLLCYYSYAWHYTLFEKELAAVKFYAVDWGWESPELRESFKKFIMWVDSVGKSVVEKEFDKSIENSDEGDESLV